MKDGESPSSTVDDADYCRKGQGIAAFGRDFNRFLEKRVAGGIEKHKGHIAAGAVRASKEGWQVGQLEEGLPLFGITPDEKIAHRRSGNGRHTRQRPLLAQNICQATVIGVWLF